MKALTIRQPWALLKACGAKEFETRGWRTNYRGPIAIHSAALNPFRAIKAVPDDTVTEMRRSLKDAGILTPSTDFRILPLGCVIATAKLVGCHEIVEVGWTGSSERRIAWIDEKLNPHYPTAREILLGDWTSGRCAWEFADMKLLAEPIPTHGQQGLWNWIPPENRCKAS
jgi:activating signal cointegrator 1